MFEFKGYHIGTAIHQTSKSIIYRAHRLSDRLPVILKVLKQEHPSSDDLTRYHQEYVLTRSLEGAGAVRTYALETNNNPVIVLEDFGAEALSIHLARSRFDVGEFLRLAILIADCLDQLFHRRVIHKDINPSNIAWNAATGELKLIDFGISTRLPQEELSLRNPSVLEGTLAYMSPEQTGRTNRSLDYRTDLYSAGATFYEMLTGAPPFEAEDALALVHCHIAKPPVPPTAVRPQLPPIISNIVLKLLEKNAEDRYQSAWGLRTDLEECLSRWEKTGHIDPFPLARHDNSGRFQIPQKLYGREEEIRTLLSAFDRVSAPAVGREVAAELLLVTGYSGIGKSVLVKEIYRPITEKRGYFIAGKFDQFQRTIPYSALTEALADLVHQFLTESAARLADWKERITAAVLRNGRIITDVIPDVELLIGPQPPVEKLGAMEALNRFNLVFQSFIQVFCRPEHPLVLFLDDLQWADIPSLKLLEVVLKNSAGHHLLVIGAYRDNEVDATHPLTSTVEELRKEGVPVHRIELAPLSIEHTSQIIADALGESTEAVATLSALTLRKTYGNPFFVRQFLNTLHAEGRLTFSAGRWRWDTAQIEAMSITDNVVDLMIRKMKRLPEGTVHALRLAACVGNRFELSTLSTISERPKGELFLALLVAVQEGLVLPTSKLEALSSDGGGHDLVILHFKFAHDRIQQAAYAFIEDDRKTAVHLQIGRLLLRSTTPEELQARIFDIMEQINLGAHMVTDPAERTSLASLNLIAGTKAKEAAAYQPAWDYLRTGLTLLNPSSWDESYDLAFNLHVAMVEVLYLNAQMVEAKRLSAEIVGNARDPLDKAKVYERQMMASVAQNEHAASLETAKMALAFLGLRLPSKPDEMAAAAAELARELKQKVASIEDLINLPEMTDPYHLAKLRILIHAAPPAYNAAPTLFPAIIFNSTKLCIEHGNCPVACVAYVWHALILSGYYADIDASYSYGRLAVKLLEKYDAVEFKAKIHNLFNAFVRHWKEHVRETMAPMMEGFHSGMQTGDIEFGLYCAIQYCNNLLFIGTPLQFVARQRGEMHALAVRLKQNYHEDYFSVGNQMVLNLLGKSKDPCLLVGEVLDERTTLPLWESVNNVTFCFIAYTCKTVLNYLFKRPASAVEMARKAEKYEPGGAGLYYSAVQIFYSSLAHLAAAAEGDADTRREYLQKVAAQQDRLAALAHHSPMNFQHKHALVEAERARLEGRVEDAQNLYEKAIRGSRQQGFIHEEALAYELAGELYLSLGRQEIAQFYLSKAYYGYIQWEASAKADHLHTSHPNLMMGSMRASGTQHATHHGTRVDTISARISNLDLGTVLKASQAISGEIVLGRLLEKMLAIMMENAGAQRGALIIEREGEFVLEAVGTVSSGVNVLGATPGARGEGAATRAEATCGPPVSECGEVPVSLVQYVMRSGEAVVLDDALSAGHFQQDPYVVEHRLKSVLCLPILNQSRRVGILFLENRAVAGAFPRERLDVLEVLASQAAISLENARLYETLEQKVDQRTEQLRTKNEEIASALEALRRTQRQLLTQEKLASLGQLTAGIAHEIRNPLTFITNFSDSSLEILEDLSGDLRSVADRLLPNMAAQIDDSISMLNNALRKVNEHGQRINRIVYSMLMHAQSSSNEYEPTNLNEMLNESARLAYHGLRVRDSDFSVEIVKDFDPSSSQVELIRADMSRVFLNIIHNACYAVRQKQREVGLDYKGQIMLRTRALDERVEVRIRDNGPGISPDIVEKIFQPFFTTKPTGEGIGLGLSISYEIVAHKHHGELRAESTLGQYAEFIITLPRRAQGAVPRRPSA